MIRMLRHVTTLFAVISVLGCEGPVGPEGPPGQDGVANRVMVSGVANAEGDVSVQLPQAVGSTPSNPPAMSCYQALTPSTGVWLQLSDGFSATSAYCALVFTGGRWNAVARDVSPGWTVAFVVTY